MTANRYVQGLPLDAMFTALVACELVLPALLELEPELELDPHAATSIAAASTAMGAATLRRSCLIG
jgi:hypothetical protein